MSETLHFLLTRYNVRFPEQVGVSRGISEAWLDERLGLFRTWTIPSIRGQTRPPDAWLIFVDAQTPPRQLAEMRAALGDTGEIVLIDGALTDERIGALVSQRTAGARRLLTTRVDNDDALALDHFARIRAAAEGFEGFLTIAGGYVLCRGHVFRAFDSSSPFLSFVEPVQPDGTVSTVFQIPHSRAAARGPIRYAGGRPGWLQVIHGSNWANAAVGLPWRIAAAQRDIGIDIARGMAKEPLGASMVVSAIARQIRLEGVRLVRRLPGLSR